MRGNKRTGLSEILAAIIMIALTLTAFAIITPGLLSKTQLQASQIAAEYQDGSVKLGELLSAVYHYETSAPLKVGIYNYGTQPVTPLYVFISTDSGQCKGSCACNWTLSPSGAIAPNIPAQLDIQSCQDSGGSPVPLAGIGTFQLFLYSNDNLGYEFTL